MNDGNIKVFPDIIVFFFLNKRAYYPFLSPTSAITTNVSQEFLEHSIPDYLIRGTDLFSLRLSNKNMTTANTTIAVQCE